MSIDPLTHWKGKALADMSREELIELADFLYQQCLAAADKIELGSELIAKLLEARAGRSPSPND